MRMPRVLFLCTGNAARSQMAEGLLRHLAGDRFEVFSAGTEPVGVHPFAVEVMREIGVDIAAHRSKPSKEFLGQSFAYVITVCDRAKERCGIFPGAVQRLDWALDDPAAATGTATERLAAFRRIRDQIEQRVRSFIARA